MPYPLIILGAGASYDFTHPNLLGLEKHEQGPIFPLTDHLIKDVDSEIEAKYEGFNTLRSLFYSSVVGQRKSFEQCLENLSDHDQRSGLLLYLGDFFWKKSNDDRVKSLPNNFKALVEIIKKSPVGGANFVTFNYDLLLEKAVDSSLNQFFNLQDYISRPIRVIKIHGSCDWYRLINQSAKDIYTALKQRSNIFNSNDQILTKRWLSQKDSGAQQFFHVPVIAIPITSTKSYTCPQEHINVLTEALPATKKVLVIGWKAGDPFLLEKLKTINEPVDLIVVSGNKHYAEDVANIVKKHLKVKNLILFEGGFSDFIGSDECSIFFSDKTFTEIRKARHLKKESAHL